MVELRDDALPLLDRAELQQGEGEPAAQHTPAHGGLRRVEDVEETLALLAVHRLEDLEAAEGKAIQAHGLQALDAPERGEVPQLGVARQLEVIEDGARGGYGARLVLEAEPLEALQAELLLELAPIVLQGEGPVLHLVDEAAVAEALVE